MSAVERASKASEVSSAEQANERTDKRVTQYFSLYSWLFWTIVAWCQGMSVREKKVLCVSLESA